ncbi:hypothetical protein BC567DRAFT_221162 [Phyllosticta citribraziliensis]
MLRWARLTLGLAAAWRAASLTLLALLAVVAVVILELVLAMGASLTLVLVPVLRQRRKWILAFFRGRVGGATGRGSE